MRKLAGDAAAIFAIADRGLPVPGAWTDLMLFGPATVHRRPKREVFDLPDGAPRLTTPAVGEYGVEVNGVQVADAAGIRPGCGRPGRVMRAFDA